jgi:hypothetical protein
MNLLAVSDQVIDRLYSGSVRASYPNVDFIIGCGDLPYPYLEFLVSAYNVPLYYVPGNHDPLHTEDPGGHVEGGINLDGATLWSKSLLFAGLGGSIAYQPNTPNQYSQQEMFLRATPLLLRIALARLLYRQNVDVFVAHSPPAGVHDDNDPAHQGLQALNLIIRYARPRYFLHGHTIFYRQNLNSHISAYHQTSVINVYPFRLLEILPKDRA